MRTIKLFGLIVAILGLLTAITALVTEAIKLYRELPTPIPDSLTVVATSSSGIVNITPTPRTAVANPTSEFIPGAKVIYQTKFDDIVGWGMSGSADINDNILVLKEHAGAGHKTSLSTGDGILVLFRCSSGTEANIVLDDANNGGNYIGIKITPTRELIVSLGENNTWMGGQLLNGNLDFTTDHWYYILIEIKDGGEFYLKVWDKDNSSVYAEKTLPMGNDWENLSWNGTFWAVEGNSGQIEVTYYEEIRFSSE